MADKKFKKTPNQEQRWTNTPVNKKDSELVMNVELVIQPSNYGGLPYIIVQNDYEDKQNMNWVKLQLDGTVIGDEELIFDEEFELAALKEWIEINKLAILMYWTQLEASSFKIIKMLKTVKTKAIK